MCLSGCRQPGSKRKFGNYVSINEEDTIVKEPNKEIRKPSNYFCADELLAKSGGSIFRLTRIAMNRALELAAGNPPLISHPSKNLTTIALQEIAQGRIVYKTNGMAKGKKGTKEIKADLLEAESEVVEPSNLE